MFMDEDTCNGSLWRRKMVRARLLEISQHQILEIHRESTLLAMECSESGESKFIFIRLGLSPQECVG